MINKIENRLYNNRSDRIKKKFQLTELSFYIWLDNSKYR